MIEEKILNDIKEYCSYNNIDDIKTEVNRLLLIGFNVMRFGTSPFKKYDENEIVKKEKKKTIKKEKVTQVVEENIKDEDNKTEVPVVEVKKKVRIIKNK